jgi:hypothetical protein
LTSTRCMAALLSIGVTKCWIAIETTFDPSLAFDSPEAKAAKHASIIAQAETSGVSSAWNRWTAGGASQT